MDNTVQYVTCVSCGRYSSSGEMWKTQTIQAHKKPHTYGVGSVVSRKARHKVRCVQTRNTALLQDGSAESRW